MRKPRFSSWSRGRGLHVLSAYDIVVKDAMEKDSSRQRTSRFPRIQHKDEKMLNDWIKNKQITTTMTILKAIDPSNSCLSQDCDPKGSESETCQLDASFINRLQAVPPPLSPHSQSSSRHVQLAFFQFTDFFFFLYSPGGLRRKPRYCS